MATDSTRPPTRAVVTIALALIGLLALTGCASESRRTVAPTPVATYMTGYSGPKYLIVIGQFHNSSPYMRGIFSEGPDRLGSQAKTILKTHLGQTNRFRLMDRDNLAEMEQENQLAGRDADIAGAEVLVTGEVTEFGRKTTGDRWFFGIFGRGKSQVAYSKISLNVVDARTSEVVYSVQGAGEYELSSREILGTGGTQGYDSTLNGKVLDYAIVDAVNKLVDGLHGGQWSPVRG